MLARDGVLYDLKRISSRAPDRYPAFTKLKRQPCTRISCDNKFSHANPDFLTDGFLVGTAKSKQAWCL
jgi:hypothetical protein